MDLISREAVINIATSSCLDLDSYDDTDEFCDEVKEIPSAFEGMTNGEVIQALFPNIEVERHGLIVSVKGLDCDKGALNPYRHFYSDWWNAPYKAESEDKEI